MPDPMTFEHLVATARRHRQQGRSVFETTRAMLAELGPVTDRSRLKSAIRNAYTF